MSHVSRARRSFRAASEAPAKVRVRTPVKTGPSAPFISPVERWSFSLANRGRYDPSKIVQHMPGALGGDRRVQIRTGK